MVNLRGVAGVSPVPHGFGKWCELHFHRVRDLLDGDVEVSTSAVVQNMLEAGVEALVQEPLLKCALIDEVLVRPGGGTTSGEGAA